MIPSTSPANNQPGPSYSHAHPHPAFFSVPTSTSTAAPTDPTPISIPDTIPRQYGNTQSRLSRAYPLLLLCGIDAYHTASHLSSISNSITVLSLVRIGVLAYIGITKRWRYKKGLMLFICGMTLIYAIWEGCNGLMRRGSDERGKGEGDGRYLVVTSALSIIEYLSYLLLLRLCPPSHSVSNLSYKLPLAQTPSSIRVRSSRNTPGSVRFHPHPHQHRRHVSRGTLRSVRSARGYMDSGVSQVVGLGEPSAASGDVFTSSAEIGGGAQGILERRSLDKLSAHGSGVANHELHDDGSDHYEYEEYDEYEDDEYDRTEEEEEGEEVYSDHDGPHHTIQLDDLEDPSPHFDHQEQSHDEEDDHGNEDDDDVSSISSSSIIDLPPPLSTHPLPRSTSLNINVHLGGLENSPIVGPIIRRSRSARFLGGAPVGSWGSSPGASGMASWFSQRTEEGQGDGREEMGDYGTFDR